MFQKFQYQTAVSSFRALISGIQSILAYLQLLKLSSCCVGKDDSKVIRSQMVSFRLGPF